MLGSNFDACAVRGASGCSNRSRTGETTLVIRKGSDRGGFSLELSLSLLSCSRVKRFGRSQPRVDDTERAPGAACCMSRCSLLASFSDDLSDSGHDVLEVLHVGF